MTFSDGVSFETLVLKKAAITAPAPLPSTADENGEEGRDDSGDEKTEQASTKKEAKPAKRRLGVGGR